MKNEWRELTELTGGESITVEKVRIKKNGITIEGEFELPPLAHLTLEEQIFVAAFIKTQGSIKDMEDLFGISYPTVKNRLNKLAEKLDFIEINPPASRNEVLEQLENKEISFEEALKKLKDNR
ncbi:MAG: DUF2089 domain-containing protein [Actinomycetota bacterium]|nr:DUF2089 domain-containing protein [Actinomycetota bacterium]